MNWLYNYVYYIYDIASKKAICKDNYRFDVIKYETLDSGTLQDTLCTLLQAYTTTYYNAVVLVHTSIAHVFHTELTSEIFVWH